jgi:hypothetical protein
MYDGSYIKMNAKVSTMTEGEMIHRREEIYQMRQSNDEKARELVYIELGLIEYNLKNIQCQPS